MNFTILIFDPPIIRPIAKQSIEHLQRYVASRFPEDDFPGDFNQRRLETVEMLMGASHGKNRSSAAQNGDAKSAIKRVFANVSVTSNL